MNPPRFFSRVGLRIGFVLAKMKLRRFRLRTADADRTLAVLIPIPDGLRRECSPVRPDARQLLTMGFPYEEFIRFFEFILDRMS